MDGRFSVYLKIALSHGGSGPHLMCGSWADLSPHPKWHLDMVQPFMQGS